MLHSATWTSLVGMAIIAAGIPCQPHSTAGQQRGTADDRDLSLLLLPLLAFLLPPALLVENVGGFFRNTTLLATLRAGAASLGYLFDTTLVDCSIFLPQESLRGCILFVRTDLCPQLPPSPFLSPPRLPRPPTIQTRHVTYPESTAASLEARNFMLTTEEINIYSPFQRNASWPPRCVRLPVHCTPTIMTTYGTAHHSQ